MNKKYEFDPSKITVTVFIKNMWRLKLGAWLVRMGCKIAGFSYVEENTDTGNVLVDRKGEK